MIKNLKNHDYARELKKDRLMTRSIDYTQDASKYLPPLKTVPKVRNFDSREKMSVMSLQRKKLSVDSSSIYLDRMNNGSDRLEQNITFGDFSRKRNSYIDQSTQVESSQVEKASIEI